MISSRGFLQDKEAFPRTNVSLKGKDFQDFYFVDNIVMFTNEVYHKCDRTPFVVVLNQTVCHIIAIIINNSVRMNVLPMPGRLHSY